jgi:hypothetical protein
MLAKMLVVLPALSSRRPPVVVIFVVVAVVVVVFIDIDICCICSSFQQGWLAAPCTCRVSLLPSAALPSAVVV